MKSALVAIAALVGIAFGASCWVSTRSGEYACDDDADCSGLAETRTCDTTIGYCVPVRCPAACDSCNQATKVCTIVCGQGSSACGSQTCPAGYTCNVTCSGNGACGTVNCGDAVGCNVTCSGGNMNNPACGSVMCGSAPCEVTCATANACDTVACNDSCACDVSCNSLGGCETASCQPGCALGLGCSSSLAGCSNVCP